MLQEAYDKFIFAWKYCSFLKVPNLLLFQSLTDVPNSFFSNKKKWINITWFRPMPQQCSRLLLVLVWIRSWIVEMFAVVHINFGDFWIPHLLWHGMGVWAEACWAFSHMLGALGKQTPRAFWQWGWVPFFEMSGPVPAHIGKTFCPFTAEQVDLKMILNQLFSPDSSFLIPK